MVCSPYVWMPPVHTQHKESMLCQTKGVSIYPIHLDAPICLDAPFILGHPHRFGCLPYVWMMFGFPLYIHNTKKACFVRLRGCPYAPYIWMPPYVWMHPCIFECPHMFGCPPYVGNPCISGCPHMFGCLLYCWMPHMFGHPLYVRTHFICLAAPLYVWAD